VAALVSFNVLATRKRKLISSLKKVIISKEKILMAKEPKTIQVYDHRQINIDR
jgi:hypothetical protein